MNFEPMRQAAFGLAILLIAVSTQAQAPAQDPVKVRVNAAGKIAPFKPIYAFFGYDEPNYTDTENGRKLIGELSALTNVPVPVSVHFLLATGDGTPGLKWGSTNAYVEDAMGTWKDDGRSSNGSFETYWRSMEKPLRNWIHARSAASKPQPIIPGWHRRRGERSYAAGGLDPPRDYTKWGLRSFTGGPSIALRSMGSKRLNRGIGSME